MKVAAQPPIFTSTPPTAAAQNSAYSYSLAATDPSGGSVTFALTAGPTGATVSGSSLAWSPTPAQSRTSDNFTVTATTSEGATATQSWSVSPTGTIVVNWINTYWEPSGPAQVPAVSAASMQVSAVVPESDGSLTVLKGTNSAPGVFTISGVPAGNYWLAFGGINLLPDSTSAYWTAASSFDAGRDIAGAPPVVLNSIAITTFDLSLSGLDSVGEQTSVQFQPENNSPTLPLIDVANSSALTAVVNVESNYDWSKVSPLLLAQYEPEALGPLSNAVLGPSALLANPSFVVGSSNTVTQTLSSTPASFDLTIDGSQWAGVLNSAGPSAPTSYAGAFSMVAEPFVTGRNASIVSSQPNFILAATANAANLFAFSPFATGCDALGVPFAPAGTPAVLTDQDLGTLAYSDPFDSTWTRAETLCEEALIPVDVPNSSATVNFAVVASSSVPPPQPILIPVVSSVQTPTIAGASLFTAATLNTTTPALSWSAPATGTAYGYRVSVFVLSTADSFSTYAPAGVFYTAQTSVTLPPLSAGNTYVFAITALADAAANVETNPFRSQLPAGFASVVSAPVTISNNATQPAIRGDARIIERLRRPEPGHGAGQGGSTRGR